MKTWPFTYTTFVHPVFISVGGKDPVHRAHSANSQEWYTSSNTASKGSSTTSPLWSFMGLGSVRVNGQRSVYPVVKQVCKTAKYCKIELQLRTNKPASGPRRGGLAIDLAAKNRPIYNWPVVASKREPKRWRLRKPSFLTLHKNNKTYKETFIAKAS